MARTTGTGTRPGRPMAKMGDRCAACGGAGGLRLAMRVAGSAGPDGLIPTTDRFGTALSDIVRCAFCGHGQLADLPAADALAAAYEIAESDDYVGEEAGQRATAAQALERIERWAPDPRGALLDLGCWVGFLLAEARDRGWRETVGVEPSAFARSYAAEQLGLDVRPDAAGLPGAHFDAVVLGDVLEHLVSPAEELARLAALLRRGGVAYLALPDAGSRVARLMGPRWWSVIPTHVHYFTRRSMRTLLHRCGWEPLWIGTAPKAFSVEYYLGRVRGYSPPAGDALVRAAGAVGVASRMWAPDFRDRMAVVARPR